MCFWGKSEKKVVEQEKRFKTFEDMALDTLRLLEIRELEKNSISGEVSVSTWAKAMGYKNTNAFSFIWKKLREQNRIIVEKRGITNYCKYKMTPKDEKILIEILKKEVLG